MLFVSGFMILESHLEPKQISISLRKVLGYFLNTGWINDYRFIDGIFYDDDLM